MGCRPMASIEHRLLVFKEKLDQGKNSSAAEVSPSEKLSPSPVTCKSTIDAPINEGDNHKLFVKIPNRGCCPVQSVTGSVTDPSLTDSRAFSPMLLEEHDALIESAVKCSESAVPGLMGDDVRMNFLATVAEGEISKSGMVSPMDSQAKDDDQGIHSGTSVEVLPQNGDTGLRSNGKSDEFVSAASLPPSSSACTLQKTAGDEDGEQFHEEKGSIQYEAHDLAPGKQSAGSKMETENTDDGNPRAEETEKSAVDNGRIEN
ncbi:hypothetical protein Nepgr_018645 [Nepenthes gracilis]|uniref:Uncharacterized protein n=1 Tax=Nepenthes gracilis TaxID=150966 RepID=A0AAD3SU31_NEPGR|nr:hypothetical protein Nepgr_018645 [Nepenthes gracilis]